MSIQYLSQRPKTVARILFCIFYAGSVTPTLAYNTGNAGDGPLYTTGRGLLQGNYPPVNTVDYTPPAAARYEEMPAIAAAPELPAMPEAPKKTIQKEEQRIEKDDKADRKDEGPGPGQPEMSSFQSVNATNLVDLFSGDFSYNIPLMDVGGYPINLHYQSGISMDQEASWVGLGWNINPGTVSRNMRGLPDDFNGEDRVVKILSMKDNRTIGVTAGANAELIGKTIDKSKQGNDSVGGKGTLGFSVGVFHNTYKGWGVETGINAGINSGSGAKGPLSGGLSITNNSQEGLDVSPSFSYRISSKESEAKGLVSIGTNYNSRMGIQALQISGEVRNAARTQINENMQLQAGTGITSQISFARPSFTPSATIPFTSRQFAFTVKVGFENWAFHPNFYIRGYASNQFIKDKDTALSLPSFGYLYYQNTRGAQNVLLDFNREKDVAYREKTPHVAIPVYTYDAFNISGEGTGGMFRAYRGDVGYVHDHLVSTKSESNKFSLDLGFGNIFHGGIDFNGTYASTTNSPWLRENSLKDVIGFRQQDSAYEPVYFKNPGEKTSTNQQFFNQLGDENLVRVKLSPQFGQSAPNVYATRYLQEIKNGNPVKQTLLTNGTYRQQRDKRTQSISYLTALEATKAGLDTIIKSYFPNSFPVASCINNYEVVPRVDNLFRKAHHISEVSVLGDDGRQYRYGIPVYNMYQTDVTFSTGVGDENTGLVTYSPGDNSTRNRKGKDNYFNREILPPYSHSFLLSSITSTDYVDLKGDGITEDDMGDAIKFNYSRIYGKLNPYRWRAPFGQNQASYNPALKTDTRDERGTYSYGERELWYMNSIESKAMIATFVLDLANPRKDAFGVNDENGGRNAAQPLYRLKEINLYSKADFVKNGVANAKPIKTVHFEYDYTLCKNYAASVPDSGKLTLKKVWFSYNKNYKGQRNPYGFTYHATNPDYTGKAYDRWGNYKNPDDNPGPVGQKLTNAEFPYALQGDSTRAATNAAAWTLSEIRVPSGGKIKVTYESDDYGYVQNKRATQMMAIMGFGNSENASPSAGLYPAYKKTDDYMYVYVTVPEAVSSKQEIMAKYLEGIKKLYFKLLVKMPSTDIWGTGYEYIPVYADIADYGIRSAGSNQLWIKVQPVKGESPFGLATMQFLRLNLPSKAYPGSEPGDNIGFTDAVKMIFTVAWNMKTAVQGFAKAARSRNWCNEVLTDRSFIRLNTPSIKKLGGGLRVKKVELYDNWNAMTGKTEAVYGQTYDYSTTQLINGVPTRISSGVAAYEPAIGNDENPFKVPIDYVENIGLLAPTNYLYTEEPFGETFFPAPNVGYSKVRVQTIHKTKKSANGFSETEFYTSRDFPVRTEFSPLDNETKKTYHPLINNFLKFNAKHFVTLSQGFKVELNDMNGKMKSQASYPQHDPTNPVSYTYNYYKLENDAALQQRLSNTVPVMDSTTGRINPNGQLGKDIEVMIDLREQVSKTFSGSAQVNVDYSQAGIIPVIVPSFIPLPSFETNQFRSVAVMKVVNKYALLDSVVVIDKGSKVSTKNMVYDGESGAVLLTRTNNEFDDPIYNFNYPAHWAYSGVGPAYKNIGAIYNDKVFKRGRMYNADRSIFGVERHFESGDEILALVQDRRLSVFSNDTCNDAYYYFYGPYSYKRIWAIDAAKGLEKDNGIFFIDKDGKPFSGYARWMKIIRSGKRNLVSTTVGSITSLANPWRQVLGVDRIVIDSNTLVINAGAGRFKDFWATDNVLRQIDSCITTYRADSTTLNPHTTALLRYHAPRRRPVVTTTDYGYNKVVASYQRYGDDEFINRSLIKFDFSLIPSNSIVTNANITFKGVAPRNLNGHTPWTTTQDSYEGTREAFDGYLFRYPYYWSGANQVPWLSGNTLNSLAYNRATLPYAGNFNGCVNFNNIYCANVIQEAIQQPVDYQGLMLKINNEWYTGGGSRELRYMSFGGKRLTPIKFDECLTENWSICNRNCPITLKVWYNVPETRCFKVCVSQIAQKDTLNPYVYGILGNWRMDRSYAYYDRRKESDPLAVTNARKDGQIKSFMPYWTFTNGYMQASADTMRWVWNSEMRTYNRKGFEIENRDPMGRHNSGNYGYNQSLPIAVTQNSKNREMVFEGFEDFDYQTDTCVKCQSPSWIDHRIAGGTRVNNLRHTGKYSLRVNGGQSSNTPVPIGTVADDTLSAQMSIRVDSVNRGTSIVTGKGTGLRARYGVWMALPPIINTCAGFILNNTVWFGSTELTNVNKNWGGGRPPQVCANNYFAAEWTGKIQPRYTEVYTIYTRSDDRIRVRINGRQVSRPNAWAEQNGSVEYADTISLVAGRLYDILVEYQEIKGDASAYLSWSSSTQFKEIIPLSQLYKPDMVPADSVGSVLNIPNWCVLMATTKPTRIIQPKFSPIRGSKLVLGAWVREDKVCADGASYTNTRIRVTFNGATTGLNLLPKGPVIDGWQRVEDTILVPANAIQMNIYLDALSGLNSYFDDVRVHPFNSVMKSYVYNPGNIRLMAELDENNYASIYEYDDDGTLIRVKKETAKGVKTVQETRSALRKE